MENKINNIFNSNNIRLVDVFITGPLQIYVSTFLKNIYFKYFILLTGVLNITFNGYVFLLKSKYIKQKHRYLKHFITENGKTQIHRLYNLFIMYPIFLYIILNFKLPTHLQLIFFINIITGFIFNLYNFIVIRQKYITLNM
jgi:hypothetical protein